nr:sugar ABC transporter ATP-binding protein [Limnochorda pilosa]
MKAPDELLVCRKVTKRFPGVVALDGVDFDVRRGEIHVLLGENGAGKSTLVKLLSGVHRPDAGTLSLEGRQVAFASPFEAQQAGISTVHQELALVPHLTATENIFLGALPRSRRLSPVIDWRAARLQAQALLDRLGAHVPPDAPVGELSVAQRQLVEIARALRFRSRLLILDEPTSSLSDEEAQTLFRVMRQLADTGVAVVFISHRLADVYAVGERVTVLRDGRKVGTYALREIDEAELIKAMVGREVATQYPRHRAHPGPEVLRVEDLRLPGARHAIGFSLREGEILGLAGLVGSGRTELVRALFGADPMAEGRVWVDGRPVRIRRPGDAIRAGLGFVPEDRKAQGLILGHPVRHNITLAVLHHLVNRLGVVRGGEERRVAGRLIERMNVRLHDDLQPVASLSGGNQQKVVLARWLAGRSRVIVMDEPTRGVDVGARWEIYRLIVELVEQGLGVIIISSELPEVLGLADRILVLREGELAGELPAAQATQEAVMRLAVPAGNRSDVVGGR